jgi:hypothetical protein
LAVVGIEPEAWITDAYPPEEKAPNVTAAVINAARKKRGDPPVPEEAEEEEPESSLSLDDPRRIAARVA